MSRQKTRQDRDLVNNPRTYQSVGERLEPMLACCNVSDRYNAMYGIDEISAAMLACCSRGLSIGAYANAQRSTPDGGSKPTDRWYANAITGLEPSDVQESFEGSIAGQLARLKKLGKIPKDGLDVAIDGHLIPRYDKQAGEEVTRSRGKAGTNHFERYMTAHGVNDGLRVVLAAGYLKSGESVPDSVEKLLDAMRDAGIKIRLMLFDREFFSVKMVACLKRRRVPFLMPCRNTDNVVAALREFDQKKRDATSKNTLENDSESVTYDMIITERKSRRKEPDGDDAPERKYIGFATNRPSVDTEEYAKRWGIETGYRMIEYGRARTRTKDRGARMLCFYYTMLLYNEWIIARITLCDGSGREVVMTLSAFMVLIWKVIHEPWPPP